MLSTYSFFHLSILCSEILVKSHSILMRPPSLVPAVTGNKHSDFAQMFSNYSQNAPQLAGQLAKDLIRESGCLGAWPCKCCGRGTAGWKTAQLLQMVT